MVKIEGNDIVIRIPIETLDISVNDGYDLGYLDYNVRLVDKNVFAKDLVTELERESEDGSTLINEMLDQACNQVIENGSLGVEEIGENVDYA